MDKLTEVQKWKKEKEGNSLGVEIGFVSRNKAGDVYSMHSLVISLHRIVLGLGVILFVQKLTAFFFLT